MEHSIQSVDLVRPWRTATLVASTVAALELVVLVGIGAFVLGKPLLARGEQAAAAPRAAPVAHSRARASAGALAQEQEPALSRAETSVLILNGNGESGAAAAGAAHVRERGYVVGGVGNAPRTDYPRTIVMFRPGFRAEGARLASDLGAGTAAPLDGLRVRDLMGAHVAVVLGN